MVRNHCSNFSQTKKNNAETSRSRTQARPYARPLLHMSYHPTAHPLTVSPHSIMSMPEKSPSYPSIPSASPPLSHSTHRVMLRCMRSRQTHGDRDRRGLAIISVRHFVYMYVCTLDPHASTTRIYSLPPASILPACSAVPPAVFSRVSRIFQHATVLQPQLTCERVGGAQRAISIATFVSCLVLCSRFCH